jgi:transcriptional antiterminator NusG
MKMWYVLFTKSGCEEKVGKIIKKIWENEIEVLIPRRKIIERIKGEEREKIKLLFPGYVFVKTEMTETKYHEITSVLKQGVFLKEDKMPASLKEEEMRVILNLTGGSDLIDVSRGVKEGDRVKIIEGPLLGYEGFIQKVDKRKKRAKVIFKVAGEVKTVDLGLEIVEKMVLV